MDLSGRYNYIATFTCDWALQTAISSSRRQALNVDMCLLDHIGGDCSKYFLAPVRCRFFLVFSRIILQGYTKQIAQLIQNTKFRVQSTQWRIVHRIHLLLSMYY